MTGIFAQGGIVMYPLVAVALGVVWLAGRSAWLIRRGDAASSELDGSLHGLLFWGLFAALLGLLGTSIGVIQMAQAATLARSVDAYLIWGGLGVALVTLIFGLLILLLAGLLWFALRAWSLRASRGATMASPA